MPELQVNTDRAAVMPGRCAGVAHLCRPVELGASVTSRRLLRARAGMAAFPAALSCAAGQHQPDMGPGVGVDPVTVVHA
ncbi:MAG: hypothetical protein LC679_08470, partial [Intrasporangiaceae bacterium]|nr:hypothetical protein [Intrasporangiaceae bacterium]